MCRAHGIGFDMKVITCCARVSSSFDHVSFAMQYAVQCSVCLRTFRWDFVLFCFIFFRKIQFPNIMSIKTSSDSPGEVKSEDTKSRLIICYL